MNDFAQCLYEPHLAVIGILHLFVYTPHKLKQKLNSNYVGVLTTSFDFITGRTNFMLDYWILTCRFYRNYNVYLNQPLFI